MVFVLRQIQEKCREQNMGLYATFVDLTKAFDTVSREGLWKILEKSGCPPKFLAMIIQLHENQQGQVRYGQELSAPFPIENGVKQGCVLAPTLFSIFFSMMLEQAAPEKDIADGIYIRFRTDGSVFNLRRLKSTTLTSIKLIHELLFADDAALLAHTQKALQHITTCFAEASKLFGLEISLSKTEVLHQPAPEVNPTTPDISINETNLKAVNQFTYLGCVITSDALIDKDVDNRLAKANSAFGRLYKRVWNCHNLKKDTKVCVYRAVVLTTLLYGAESWVTYRRHISLLERFHQRCLRTILNIKWEDYITNVEVLQTSKCISIEAMLLKTQLRWAGHVSKMEEHRLPKQTFFGELAFGHRDVGGQYKRYKDTLKKGLIASGIDEDNWESTAKDRDSWRLKIKAATELFEANRISILEEKRHRRKNPDTVTPDTTKSHPCSRCGRVCLSRIGLFSHQRACPK